MNDRQFRKYVQSILLKEEDGGGDGGGYGGGDYGYGGMGGPGMGMYMMGSNEGLYKIFVKPFVDVIQTTSGVTKEVMRRTWTLASVALETIVTTFVPVITDSYDEIFENERRDIEALRAKYKDIYAANNEMFTNADMNVIAFGMDPSKYMSAIFLKKAPKTAFKALEILTGDHSTIKFWYKKMKMLYDFTGSDREWQKKEWQYNLMRRRFDDSSVTASGTRRIRGESRDALPVITEEDEKGSSDQSWKKDAMKRMMSEMMSDQDVIDAIENSPKAKQMHDDSVAIIKKFHAAVKEEASNVDHIKDFNTLKAFVKATKNSKAIKALDDLERVVQQPQKQTSQNEGEGGQINMQKLIPQFVIQAKKALKGIFGSGIASQIKAAHAAGMPDDSEIVQILTAAKRDVEKV